MREAENTGSGPVSANDRAASPIKVGAVVLAVALAAWGLLWLTTRPEEPAGGGVDRGPAFALTNTEAAERMQTLLSERDEAFHERSMASLTSIYTSSSPVADIARHEIRRLSRDNVLDRSRFLTLSLEVVSNDAKSIQIRQDVEITPRFVTEEGEDVTKSPDTLRQMILWTLKPERGVWKIHDSVLQQSRVGKGRSS